MADIMEKTATSIRDFALNFLRGSILADIILHPLDFVSVLVQIGYFPDALKQISLAQVVLQYAVYSLYIPYVLSSLNGIHFMGLPAPSFVMYIYHVYKKEGLMGCYRGLPPKIFERLVMTQTYSAVGKLIRTGLKREMTEEDKFMRQLVNCLCCQFFAVIASHPFHVTMIHGFADFTKDLHNGMLSIMSNIYIKEGYFGFFVGLAARLVGEIISLFFSLTYTHIVNKQFLQQERCVPVHTIEEEATEEENDPPAVNSTTQSHIRKRRISVTNQGGFATNEMTVPNENPLSTNLITPTTNLCLLNPTLLDCLGYAGRTGTPVSVDTTIVEKIFEKFPQLKSKYFYTLVFRDVLSKKISYPFLLVCHNSIVNDTGWEKLPLIPYFESVGQVLSVFIPRKLCATVEPTVSS